MRSALYIPWQIRGKAHEFAIQCLQMHEVSERHMSVVVFEMQGGQVMSGAAASSLAVRLLLHAPLTAHALTGTALASARQPPGNAGGTVRRAGVFGRQQARSPHVVSPWMAAACVCLCQAALRSCFASLTTQESFAAGVLCAPAYLACTHCGMQSCAFQSPGKPNISQPKLNATKFRTYRARQVGLTTIAGPEPLEVRSPFHHGATCTHKCKRQKKS